MSGSSVIAEAVGRDDLRLVAVARREVALPKGARMEVFVAPSDAWATAIAKAQAQVLICALGITLARAGSRDAFRKVDHDLVLAVADAARAAGIEHMIAISSVEANPGSKSFYLRTKGEVEAALGQCGFRRLDLLRPGLLRGSRDERRRLETAAQVGAPLLDLALHGRIRRFRSIAARDVARAALALSGEPSPGQFVHEYDGIKRAMLRRSS
jgi:uncharacterized protein YbjT (DUF2867 family)